MVHFVNIENMVASMDMVVVIVNIMVVDYDDLVKDQD